MVEVSLRIERMVSSPRTEDRPRHARYWSTEEDLRLLQAVYAWQSSTGSLKNKWFSLSHSFDWARISSHVGTRGANCCRLRWERSHKIILQEIGDSTDVAQPKPLQSASVFPELDTEPGHGLCIASDDEDVEDVEDVSGVPVELLDPNDWIECVETTESIADREDHTSRRLVVQWVKKIHDKPTVQSWTHCTFDNTRHGSLQQHFDAINKRMRLS